MVVYQRPEGKASLTNPDYPIYCQKCGGKLYDSDHDAVVELYKGVGRARDLLAIGARSPAQATEKALNTFPVAAKGQVSTCPRCQKWSHDFHGDAAPPERLPGWSSTSVCLRRVDPGVGNSGTF
jgi:hypothetical protein